MADGPNYTWKHGVAWLAVAAACWLVVTGGVLEHASALNRGLAFILGAGSSLIGIGTIVQDYNRSR